jgi:hypothetical protein
MLQPNDTARNLVVVNPEERVKMAATARKDRVRAGTNGGIKLKRHREDILGFRWTQSDYPNRHGVQKLIGPARPFNSTDSFANTS